MTSRLTALDLPLTKAADLPSRLTKAGLTKAADLPSRLTKAAGYPSKSRGPSLKLAAALPSRLTKSADFLPRLKALARLPEVPRLKALARLPEVVVEGTSLSKVGPGSVRGRGLDLAL